MLCISFIALPHQLGTLSFRSHSRVQGMIGEGHYISQQPRNKSVLPTDYMYCSGRHSALSQPRKVCEAMSSCRWATYMYVLSTQQSGSRGLDDVSLAGTTAKPAETNRHVPPILSGSCDVCSSCIPKTSPADTSAMLGRHHVYKSRHALNHPSHRVWLTI
jgi:hypothetical protein